MRKFIDYFCLSIQTDPSKVGGNNIILPYWVRKSPYRKETAGQTVYFGTTKVIAGRTNKTFLIAYIRLVHYQFIIFLTLKLFYMEGGGRNSNVCEVIATQIMTHILLQPLTSKNSHLPSAVWSCRTVLRGL